MTKYTIKTPNQHFSGTWNGIQFKNGTGTTQKDSLAAAARVLGYSVTSDTPQESKPSEGLTEPPARRSRTRKTGATS